MAVMNLTEARIRELPMGSGIHRDEQVKGLMVKGSRKGGWERMRTMLSQAGKPDLPGLYISTLCRYAWETLPVLPRDARDIEDVDSDAPDHAADAIRYGVIYEKPRWTVRDF